MFFFRNYYKLRQLLRFLEDIYRVNDDPNESDSSNYDVLERTTLKLLKLIKIIICVLFVAVFCTLIILTILAHYRILYLPFYLPGLDNSTIYGFRILFVFDIVCLFFAVNGVLYSDLMAVIFIYHIHPLALMLQKNSLILNRKIELAGGKSVKVKRWLLNMAKMHTEFFW